MEKRVAMKKYNWMLLALIFLSSNLMISMEKKRIDQTVFREYDIRGIIGTEIPIDEVYNLTCAIAAYLVSCNKDLKTVTVGMDGRTHSQAIKEQVCKALTDCGINTIFIGLCTTPALYFSLHTMPVDGGIMITASHNPKEYNGFKICLGKESICGQQIKEVGTLYAQGARVNTTHKGTLSEQLIHTSYINYLAERFEHLKNIDLPVAFDCGNAAAGMIIPGLIQKMNWKKTLVLYPEIDGTYPNHEADPTIEKNMRDLKNIVHQGEYAYGIGFDGDADRMGALTKTGYLIPGDRLMALFAKPIIAKNPGATIVCDISSSSALINTLESWGAHACMVATGHVNIKAAMHREKALLGGELSCHFSFADRYFGFDDGIYSALRLIELITQSDKNLDAMVSELPLMYSTPVLRIPCEPKIMKPMISAVHDFYAAQPDTKLITIDGIRATTNYGWGLIRASNTQPVITIRFESGSQEGLTQLKQEFAGILSPYLSHDTIAKYFGI